MYQFYKGTPIANVYGKSQSNAGPSTELTIGHLQPGNDK